MALPINKAKIKQIISRQVITVSPETPVSEAIAVMARASISCLVIAEKKKPVGIFTERDIVRVAHRHTALGARPISEFMTSPVFTIQGNSSILETYHFMVSNKIRHHVVIDGTGKILGVLSQSDLTNLLGLEYFVEMRKIEQIMTFSVVTVTRDVPVTEAIACMARPEISCVVVANGGNPEGIITERDTVRLVAEGLNLDTTPVSAVMSSPVRTVPAGTTVHKAAMVMKQEKIRRVVVVDGDGKIEGIVTQTDIIKGLEGKYIRSLKEIVQEKEEMLQQTTRELLDKTVYLDNILSSSIDIAIIATDGDFRIKYINPLAERLLGHKAASAIGRATADIEALERIFPVKLAKAREVVRKKGKYAFAAEMLRDGTPRCYDCSLTRIMDKQGKLIGFVLMMHDVTERRQQEITIHHMAYHDALTGLPNRVMLNDRLSQALALARRSQKMVALMILDLDRFKDVNDSLGHSIGDLLLIAVGSRLQGILRKSDTVSRMGGDEFVLLLPTVVSAETAEHLAGRIIKAFRKPFTCDGHTMTVTASVGIATFPEDGTDEETLLKNADIALYRAKELGRNNFQRYTPS